MGNIYNYLKTAWPQLIQPRSNHPVLVVVAILLISVPLSRAAGNIAFMLLGLFSLLQFRKHLFLRKDYALFLPIALFLLMMLSLLWSVDVAETANALWKELTLLAIPLCFLMFPAFSKSQKNKVLHWYALAMSILASFYIIRALVRFLLSGNTGVFFYHELVNVELNAIHVSVYMAVGFFAILARPVKSVHDLLAMAILFVTIILLSSKNILVVFFALLLFHYIFYSRMKAKRKIIITIGLLIILSSLTLFTSIRNRFALEYASAITDNTTNPGIRDANSNVYNVSIRQAWIQERFGQNAFFPGTAFRVYQFRIFMEMLHEDNIFFTGYGLNASYNKVKDKATQHDLYMGNGTEPGYQNKNFHNQYVQNFAELGVFGFLLLIIIVIVTLFRGIKSKDFAHISFAILMISLFLTETFLWRQRGVMFFTAFYCLFNSGMTYLVPEKEKLL